MNIAVLGSTRGTDLQAIIDAIENKELDVNLSIVISNKEDAYILERAKKHNIPNLFMSTKDKTREDFDKEVMGELEKRDIDLILLIGYMRFLSVPFVERYRNMIMNVHPSLLPAFAGGMDKNVHQAVLDSGVKVSGCTIHFVDEGADTGPIILQDTVKIDEDETVDSLKAKVQDLEGKLFIKAIKLFQENKIRLK